MLEIRKILAPTDFSEHARSALRYAAGLAAKLGAELHLVHVLPDVVPAGPDLLLAPTLPPEYYQETEQQARDALRDALAPDWERPEVIAHDVRWGDAVDGIVAHASEHGVDLIVTATHGRTGLSHVLLGSVAERIVRESPCPVLTVRCR